MPRPESYLGQVRLSSHSLGSLICLVPDSNFLLPKHFFLLLDLLLMVIAFLFYYWSLTLDSLIFQSSVP